MNDNPNPNGPKPEGISDSAWYGYTTVDSTKPLSWWQDMDRYYDPSATGYARYKSDKIDPRTGKNFEGTYEHPDSLPDGWTAWGKNTAKQVNDPAVQAMWGNTKPQAPGTAQPDPSQSATPTNSTVPTMQPLMGGANYQANYSPMNQQSSQPANNQQQNAQSYSTAPNNNQQQAQTQQQPQMAQLMGGNSLPFQQKQYQRQY